jgi:aminopeptidase N
MSSYLVALILSDFVCIKSVAKPILSKNINVSVCARPNAIDQLDYALNNSIKILEFFETFYNVKYPLPKCGIFLNTFRLFIYTNKNKIFP